ncbi:hypothetical protein MXB_1663 [Myxobolus squamalis]|nr:hypothetical protein MXB_1663 [Myxobolus squamalis]
MQGKKHTNVDYTSVVKKIKNHSHGPTFENKHCKLLKFLRYFLIKQCKDHSGNPRSAPLTQIPGLETRIARIPW